MAGIRVHAAVLSNKGHVRRNNEDSYFLNGLYLRKKAMDRGGFRQIESSDELQVYAVCDGMGGEDAGEDASLYAVRTLRLALKKANGQKKTPAEMARLIASISKNIHDESAAQHIKSGTTIAMLVISDGHAYPLHVGDSRVYLLREGRLSRLTKDHTHVQALVNEGQITEKQAQAHPERHLITRYLGMEEKGVEGTVTVGAAIELLAGDRFLICSDGLTDMLSDERIERLLNGVESVGFAVRQLAKAALDRGGKDNITVLCVQANRPQSAALRVVRGLLSAAGCASLLAAATLLAEAIFKWL